MKMHRLSIVFLAIVLWSCGSTLSEDKRIAFEAALNEKYTELAAIYNSVMTFGKNPGADAMTFCAAPGYDENNPMPMNVVYFKELEKYTTKETSVWERDRDEWSWMSSVHATDNKDGHFKALPENLNDIELWHACEYATQPLEGSYLAEDFLGVIFTENEAGNTMPELLDEESFETGYFSGWLFVVHRETAEVVCNVPLEVESSASLSYKDGATGLVGIFANDDPERVLNSDFKENFAAAINKAVVHIDVHMFSTY